ncbi:MAG: DUF4373 domain-containing protein [Clostridia bacterium]|nr:DUF4373 domain-containing protein [Clostridia bacterium]
MAKVKDYFSHDYHARTDLRGIQKDFGLEGVGFYWCLVEILHENGGSIKASELEGIAYELHVSVELCTKVVNDYGKFTVKGGKISCDRVMRNLKKREEISEVRRKAAEERWGASEDDSASSEDPPPEVADAGFGAFLSTYTKRSHKESMEWYKKWFGEQFDKLESDAEYNNEVWEVRGYIENVLEQIEPYPHVTVARKKIDTFDYIHTLQYFVHNEDRIHECAEVIEDVNEKAEKGRIRNKMNYLISALYQAVKAKGG